MKNRVTAEIVSPKKTGVVDKVAEGTMTYLKDINRTRFSTFSLFFLLLLLRCGHISIPTPRKDQSNEGDRDPALAASYKGLANLRQVSSIILR